jgi:hypothetical protein
MIKEKNIKTLFINQRKDLLKLIESIFLLNNSNLSKMNFIILKTITDQTFIFTRAFTLGKRIQNFNDFNLNQSTSFMEKQLFNPFLHLDLIKTFLNSLKQKENVQLLDISRSEISFGLLGWFNGFNTVIIDENESKLEIINILTEKYSLFFRNHLIFPPNDSSSLKQIFCLKDKIPELKRIKTASQNIFEGIIASFSMEGLEKEEILHLLDRIIGLLRPGGFLLLQDYFLDEKGSSSNSLVNKNRYVNIQKNDLEQYLKGNSLKIFLRTTEFHILNKTSYIIMK